MYYNKPCFINGGMKEEVLATKVANLTEKFKKSMNGRINT